MNERRGCSKLQDTLTFDTEPIVAFLLGEPDGKPVIDLLQKVQSNTITGYINVFNLTEVYYTVARLNSHIAE
jgi:predicted nucleic acid-binding protein